MRITELPAASSVASTDLVLVVTDPSGTPTTKKATASLLANFGSQLVQTTGGFQGGYFTVAASGPTIKAGAGAPSSSDPNGSIYLRTDGTSTTGVYTRQGGAWSALGGGGGSPGGSSGQIQYNNAGAFAGAASLTTDGTYLGVGTPANLATSGNIRLADGGAIKHAYGGNTYNTLSAGVNVNLGDSTGAALGLNLAGHTIQYQPLYQHIFYLSGTPAFIIYGLSTPHTINSAFPMVGSSADSSPWGAVNGHGTVAMGDANQTASASVYSRGLIECTGALTADRNLVLPAPANNDSEYPRTIYNNTTGGHGIVVTFSGSPFNITVPAGLIYDVYVTQAGVLRRT